MRGNQFPTLAAIQSGKYAKMLSSGAPFAADEFAMQKQAEQAQEQRRRFVSNLLQSDIVLNIVEGKSIHDQIERQVAKIAHNQAVTPDEIVEKAIRSYLQTEASLILARETAAFRAMNQELLDKYAGKYVAIHQGQLINYGAKLGEVYARIDTKYSDETILIKRVQPEVERVATIRSPRIVHDR